MSPQTSWTSHGEIDAGGWSVLLLGAGKMPVQGAQLSPEGVLPSTVEIPVNALLLRGGGRTILVDAGSGPFVSLWPGATDELQDILASLRAHPDLVIITHFDTDHAGGVVARTGGGDDLSPAFFGASVIAPAKALEIARTDPPPYGAARMVVPTLDLAGVISAYEDGHEPAPGLRMRSAPGHRTGHSILEIGGSVVFVADVVHHAVQVEHLDWEHEWDEEPSVAVATRRQILGELADRSVTVLSSHLASPGRVERHGDGMRWSPLT